MQTLLLSSSYLPPVLWFVELVHHDNAVVDQHEHYQKQTFRNRCRIAMPDGPADLVIPVENPGNHAAMRDLRISDHGNWRHHHWNALKTAYGKSPFFEYYADDFAPFYEQRFPFLLDFNESLCRLVCQLIDIETPIHRSASYLSPADAALDASLTDARNLVSPKTYNDKTNRCATAYYQVFAQRLGFLPHLSIADMLFNMGPESLVVLLTSARVLSSQSSDL